MEKAIVTLTINYPLIQWSRPLFNLYATKVGAEYIEISEPRIKHPICPMLEKYQLWDLLGQYERVVFFDSDIIVSPRTPDLFKIVPPEKIGAVYDNPKNESFGDHRKSSILHIQEQMGDIGWRVGYVNSGVLVLSNTHRDAFKFDERLLKIEQRTMLEQNFTNYNIQRHKLPVHHLSRNFNMISFGGKEEGYYIKGKLADVVHLAGRSSKPELMNKFFHLALQS
jgi:lipopolysaccharide biosynthesis glycosyltransferase